MKKFAMGKVEVSISINVTWNEERKLVCISEDRIGNLYAYDGYWTIGIHEIRWWLTEEVTREAERIWEANRSLDSDELRRADGTVDRMTRAYFEGVDLLVELASGSCYAPENSLSFIRDPLCWRPGTAERAIRWGKEYLRKHAPSVVYPRPESGPHAWAKAFGK